MDVGVEQALFYSFTTQAPRAQRGAFLKQLESEVCLLRKTIREQSSLKGSFALVAFHFIASVVHAIARGAAAEKNGCVGAIVIKRS